MPKRKYFFKVNEGKSLDSTYLLINSDKVKVQKAFGGQGSISSIEMTLDAIHLETLLREAGYKVVIKGG